MLARDAYLGIKDALEHAPAAWLVGDPVKLMAFAVTEIAEAVDAELRKDPMFFRNSDRNVDVQEELADTAMMLVRSYVALGIPDGYILGILDECKVGDRRCDLEYLLKANQVIGLAAISNPINPNYIELALRTVLRACDDRVAERVKAKIAAISAKMFAGKES